MTAKRKVTEFLSGRVPGLILNTVQWGSVISVIYYVAIIPWGIVLAPVHCVGNGAFDEALADDSEVELVPDFGDPLSKIE